MPLVERLATVSDAVRVELAFHASGVELAAAADAATGGDFGKQLVAPGREALRGERPLLAAFFA
jgi:hypothetical protein